jgi:hypothetical protein
MVTITVTNGEYLHLEDGGKLFFTEQNPFWINYTYSISVSNFGRNLTHNLYILELTNLYLGNHFIEQLKTSSLTTNLKKPTLDFLGLLLPSPLAKEKKESPKILTLS